MPIHRMNTENPSLYGIHYSNRQQSDLWSKNNFNSSFPVALACYMRDNGRKAVYLSLVEKEGNLAVESSELSFDEIFNTTCGNSDLAFLFEAKYDPYQDIAGEGNDIRGIDLVVAEYEENAENANERTLIPVRPLEIKLTVVPDNSTCMDDESMWCSELVIRAATTKYCGLGILESLKKEKNKNPDIMSEVYQILNPACNVFSNRPSTAWPDQNIVFDKQRIILDKLNEFEKKYAYIQKPLLIQPVWRTKGKKPYFHKEGVFDIFVWSDLAFTRLFLDDALAPDNGGMRISRRMRSAARLIRLLYEYSSGKPLNLNEIYNQMAYSQQTDKEFAVSGRNLHKYMRGDRLANPIYKTDVLDKIIIDKEQDILNLLSPERRFDQSVMFTHKDNEIERLNEIIKNLSVRT